jgi:glycosyltransferase involved in cell wall biosynthesis
MIHSSDLWLSPYMLNVARRLKIPSVLHVRTPIRPKDVRKHKCHEADGIIAISVRVARDLSNAGIADEKIAQIDDGVDTESFKPRDNSEVRAPDSKGGIDLAIGMVGRIAEAKRQFEFLKAVSLLTRRTSRKMRFVLIGPAHSEPYFTKLQNYVNSDGLAGKVLFTGYRDDMPKVISSLDMLVTLSGGSVMFEAMACGTPVISAGFTSPANAVHVQHESTGLLVSSYSPEELAQAMLRLVEDELLRRTLGRRARNWAVCNLSHRKMVQRTSQVYAQLLTQGRHNP